MAITRLSFVFLFTALLIVFFLFTPSHTQAATTVLLPDKESTPTTHWLLSGTSRWDAVNDAVPDELGSYIFALQPQNGYITDVGFPQSGIPLGSAISRVTFFWRGQNVGLCLGVADLRVNGQSQGTETFPNTCQFARFLTFSRVLTTNPATGSAWTIAAVNSMTMGVNSLTTNTSSGIYLTQMYAEVEYSIAQPSPLPSPVYPTPSYPTPSYPTPSYPTPSYPTPSGGSGPGSPAQISGIVEIIRRIIGILAPAAGIAFFLMMLMGSFRYIKSAGDPKKIASARDTLKYAVIGAIFVAAAWLILVVIGQFTGVNVTTVSIPP